MADFLLPSHEGVQQMLTMVIGDDAVVDAHVSGEGATDERAYSHVAQFVDDDDNVVGICLSDLSLSAALGGGLSMIPPAAVEDMVTEKQLTSTARDNLYEVMNMLSSLFMDDQTPHLRLASLDHCKLPASDTADALESAGDGSYDDVDVAAFERADFSVAAGKYGKGVMTFYSA